MSGILGSERKPNATARCEQLIVDGSLQVAGLYIDGTAVGGGASAVNAAAIVVNTTAITANEAAITTNIADIGTNAGGILANTNLIVTNKALTDINTAAVGVNIPAIALNTVFRETALNDSYFVASGHTTGLIKWTNNNALPGTVMTVVDGASALKTSAVAGKYLVEVCAALKVPAGTALDQLTLSIREGVAPKGTAYYSGRAETGRVTQNVYCRAIVDANKDISVVASQSGTATDDQGSTTTTAVLVTIDIAGTSVTCRKIR